MCFVPPFLRSKYWSSSVLTPFPAPIRKVEKIENYLGKRKLMLTKLESTQWPINKSLLEEVFTTFTIVVILTFFVDRDEVTVLWEGPLIYLICKKWRKNSGNRLSESSPTRLQLLKACLMTGSKAGSAAWGVFNEQTCDTLDSLRTGLGEDDGPAEHGGPYTPLYMVKHRF